jgi:hypothetical protein
MVMFFNDTYKCVSANYWGGEGKLCRNYLFRLSVVEKRTHSLKDCSENLKPKSVDESLKLTLVSVSLIEEFAKNWFMATK